MHFTIYSMYFIVTYFELVCLYEHVLINQMKLMEVLFLRNISYFDFNFYESEF